jgi:N-methylhydantoinase A/oxoprolinase/acetone carboxylase beta subunit
MSQAHDKLYIGIDIGGTFTDFVVYRPQNSTLETSAAFYSQQPGRSRPGGAAPHP